MWQLIAVPVHQMLVKGVQIAVAVSAVGLGWATQLTGIAMMSLSGAPHILVWYGCREHEAVGLCVGLLNWGLGVTGLGMVGQWGYGRYSSWKDRRDSQARLDAANVKHAAEVQKMNDEHAARIQAMNEDHAKKREQYAAKLRDDWRSALEKSKDLDGAASVLQAILKGGAYSVIDPTVRVCICEVVGDRVKALTQLGQFTPEEQEFFRDHPVRVGATGITAFDGLWQFFSRTVEDPADYYRLEMKVHEPLCRQLSQSRKSWFAVPVMRSGLVVAVIYADSAESGFFGNKKCRRRTMLMDSALGVAEKLAPSYHPQPPAELGSPAEADSSAGQLKEEL